MAASPRRSSPRPRADGNTLWLTSAGAAVMNPALYDNLTYDMQRDFAPVTLVVNNSEVLVVNPANPARNAAELVAHVEAEGRWRWRSRRPASAACRIWRWN